MARDNDESHQRVYERSIIGTDLQQQHGSLRILKNEFDDLMRNPPEGFLVQPDQSDFFTWNVGIFGAPNTLFAGGYYKATLKFPLDYPYRPPKFKFLSDIWHPNVYLDGQICISILHEPGEDERSGEKACERWSAVQNVRSILLSIISMLNEPNISSPANIDASIDYRKYQEDPINSSMFKEKLDRLIERSRAIANAEGIEIPQTIEEYTKRFNRRLPLTTNDCIEDNDLNEDDDEQSEVSSCKSQIKQDNNASNNSIADRKRILT
ncbi:unnamed protein product [Adineta ricciae]|uniref:UBC core domain-containing protein n=1 Tax=Adineta ricciae TaxID=249248 RepID=A0A816BPN2_ADIRI|nr:unnamed protein product [Adineta ricciae]